VSISQPCTGGTDVPTTALQPEQLRVRMYRVGFGDCFLVSVPAPGGHRHILIDCGVHFRGNIKTLPQVIENLRAETADRIDLVVVTHAHQDHISGFGAHPREWAEVTVNEIWMPWTEDPTDGQAVALRTKQLSLARQLREHLHLTRQLKPATEDILENFVGFNLVSNANSMRVARGGFKGPQKVRYLEAGDTHTDAAGIPALQAQVLSPSRDESVLTKMDPPAGQRWLRAHARAAPGSETVEPFHPFRRTRSELARRAAACVLERKLERQLHNAVIADDALAMTLDDVLNNTSLVLLLRVAGSALLFPGDAQWGNWSTWLKENGADALLNEITFFKVGHHGSHNSTPRSIVPKLGHPELAAMISTQGLPFKSIPRQNLLTELTAQCHRRTVRSDWVKVQNAPNVAGPKNLPRPFKRGPLWIDYLRKL